MNTWFCSDLHFSHWNIAQYAHRPFKTVEQMNEALIRNWNSRVKKHDIVFHLGDFCFRNSAGGKEGEGTMNKAEDYLDKLNGHITFIQGNHDKNNSLNAIIKHAVIELAGQEIFLVHNPEEINTKYKINLVGHVHDLWKIKKINHSYIVNVGVDVNNWHPININEILAIIAKFEKDGNGQHDTANK